MNTHGTATRPMIAPGAYTVVPARTTVRFAVKELWGLVTVRGTFGVRDGTIVVAEDPKRSSVRVSMDPASFASGNRRRDKDVTGRNFLDAAAHPRMDFVSTDVGRDGDDWTVDGLLTVHGVTAPVTLRLVDGRQTGNGCSFSATAVVDRTWFGVSRVVGFIGRDLEVTIDIAAAASDPRSV